jgi:hypothetical protein
VGGGESGRVRFRAIWEVVSASGVLLLISGNGQGSAYDNQFHEMSTIARSRKLDIDKRRRAKVTDRERRAR